MTREEITAKIDELETRLFYVNMIDRWTWEDRNEYDKLTREIRELKNLLN